MIENRADTPDQAVSMDGKQLKNHIEELRKIGTIIGSFEGKAAPLKGVHTRRPMVPAETIEAEMHYGLKPEPAVGKQAVAATAAIPI
jgi:hypothetical protein